MNWFLYVGGWPIVVMFALVFWGSLTGKSLREWEMRDWGYSSFFIVLPATCSWIWICWRFIS